jgi:hypothetical protein
LPPPYREFQHGYLPENAKWSEREFHFRLESKASPFTDALPDLSNVVLYMALGEGTTDIASIKLFKSDKAAFEKRRAPASNTPKKDWRTSFATAVSPWAASGWNASSPNRS